MIQYRRIIITKKYFLLFLLILSLSAIANESNHKEKLKDIQNRLENVNAEIEKSKDQVKEFQSELKKNELMAAKISEQLENIQNNILKKKDNLERLKIKKKDSQKIIDIEKKILISQIKTMYKIGKYDYVKLLLNQQNVSEITRAIAYYDYDNYARSKRIKKLKNTLIDIEKIQLTILDQTSRLESLNTTHKSKLDKFNKYRGDRLKFITEINKHIDRQGVELLLLKENEHELVKLLNKLNVHKKNKTDTLKKGFSFSSKKGELIWPINGKLLKKYGEKKKKTGLKWRGVLIESVQGSHVSAVSQGKIVFADWFRNFGLLIIIDHENDYLSLYGHNQRLLKSIGDFVQTGEKIATVGDSGGQKNSALYFEIRKGKKTLNPSLWCKK
jgi:septal ring factor EnvC (AmiA/AmiB activator)